MHRRDIHTNRVFASSQTASQAPSQTMFCDEDVNRRPLISASNFNHPPCWLLDEVVFVILQGILVLAEIHFLWFAELGLVV